MADAKYIEGTGTVAEALVERLRAAGLPVVRFTTGMPSLHPRVDSFSTLWELGKGVTFREYRLTAEVADARLNSPLRIAYEEGRVVRCRLDGAPAPGEFGILADLRAEGLTDYLVLPIPFSDGSHKAVTFATDRPGGFADDEIALLETILPELAAVMEVRALRHMARTLMDTYVGPVAGQRVLDGQIDRGSVETLRAGVWLSDLRGFTALSEILPGRQIVALLNAYFEAMAGAIAEQRGEILKFIGDAVLAVFLPAAGEEEGATARRSLAAAQAAVRAVAAYNAARRPGSPAIRVGIALHFGDVLYGNVGAPDRLDFTVIGSAVNLASRLSGLSGTLGRPVLVSAEFAALHGGTFEALGSYELKGVGEARAVYAAHDAERTSA